MEHLITPPDLYNNKSANSMIDEREHIQELYNTSETLTMTLFKDKFNSKCKNSIGTMILPPVLLSTNERLSVQVPPSTPAPTAQQQRIALKSIFIPAAVWRAPQGVGKTVWLSQDQQQRIATQFGDVS